jgi:hypothetical protein
LQKIFNAAANASATLNENELNEDEKRQRIKRWLQKQNKNQSSKKHFFINNIYISK